MKGGGFNRLLFDESISIRHAYGMKMEKGALIKRHFATAALLTTAVVGYFNGGIALDATLLAGTIGASFAVYSKVIVSRGNFRTVQVGQCYRSAQLGKKRLQHEIHTLGLKSVLCLREARPNKRWYDDEIKVCREKGIAHFVYALPAGREIPLDQMDDLVELLRKAPKPLLIHCKAGADRSGYGSGLFSYAIQGNPLHIAMRQLSLLYGHFPYLISRTGAMGRSLQRYAEARPHRAIVFAPARAETVRRRPFAPCLRGVFARSLTKMIAGKTFGG